MKQSLASAHLVRKRPSTSPRPWKFQPKGYLVMIALWLRLPDEDRVRKAMLVLADFDYLHGRYYGAKGQTDFRVA
jgi:hypothetical protein